MEKNIFIALGQALFAAFCSCVKWLNMKDKKHLKLFSLISETLSGVASGVFVFLFYSAFGWNVYFSFALAGAMGALGSAGFNLLGKYIIKHSALEDIDEKKE